MDRMMIRLPDRHRIVDTFLLTSFELVIGQLKDLTKESFSTAEAAGTE
jgi:hypothetical protein